jgi:hypothetical protein
MEPTRSKGGQLRMSSWWGNDHGRNPFIQEINTAVLSASGYLLVDAWLLPLSFPRNKMIR